MSKVQLVVRTADLARQLVGRIIIWIAVRLVVALVILQSRVDDLWEVSLSSYLLSVANLRWSLLVVAPVQDLVRWKSYLLRQLIQAPCWCPENVILSEVRVQLGGVGVAILVHVRLLELLLVVVEVRKLDVVVHASLHLVVLVHTLESSLDAWIIILSRTSSSVVSWRVIHLVLRSTWRHLLASNLLLLWRVHIVLRRRVALLGHVSWSFAGAIMAQSRIIGLVLVLDYRLRSIVVNWAVLAWGCLRAPSRTD